MSDRGGRSWTAVALACAALLVVPLLALILVPAPRAPARAAAAAQEVAPAAEVEDVAPASTSTGRRVAGTVRDAEGNAVPGATVRALGHPASVTSDPSGAYALVGLGAAVTTLVASAEGFAEARVPLAADATVLDFVLTRAAPVSGTVLDPEGKPVVKAFVSCDDRPSFGAHSGEDGSFTLPAGAAGCNASAVHPQWGPAPSVRLYGDRANTLRMEKGGAISGRVVDDRGAAVSSFSIGIEAFFPAGDPSTPGPSVRTRKVEDRGGAFLLENLVAGKYVLTASAPGHPPVKSESIAVEAGRTTHHVTITLSAGASLVGRVVESESKAPIAGAKVTLDAAAFAGVSEVPSVTTGSDGAFTLAGVPRSALFSVRVEHPEYNSRVVSGLDARGATTVREEIPLTKGDGKRTEFSGIGATLAPTSGGVKVAKVLDGGPASKSGLQQDDMIVAIDGKDARELTVADCVQRLRGRSGTTVQLGVQRGGARVDLSIVRGAVSN